MNQGDFDKVYPPPIGLRPRYIVEKMRLNEICDAITRYCQSLHPIPIPIEWIVEYNELAESLKQRALKSDAH